MISWWATIPNTGFPISEWHSHSYHAPWFVPPTQPTYHYSNLERRFPHHYSTIKWYETHPKELNESLPWKLLVEVMHLLSDHFLRASPAKGIREFAGVNCGCYFITPRHLVQPPKKNLWKGKCAFFFWGGVGGNYYDAGGGLVDIFIFMDWGEGGNSMKLAFCPASPHLFLTRASRLSEWWMLVSATQVDKKKGSIFLWGPSENWGVFTGWSREHQKSGWKRLRDNISAHVHLNVVFKSTTKKMVQICKSIYLCVHTVF